VLGVTIKGGEFSAKPTLRRLEFDGVKTRTKGDTVVDGWEVYIKATLAEMTTQNFIYGLGIADKGTDEKVVGYDVITGRDVILDSDYIQNITWVAVSSERISRVLFRCLTALMKTVLHLQLPTKTTVR
jgi:hypothetical protein